MEVRTMGLKKVPIQELTGDQLDVLVLFEKTEAFAILKELAEKEKYHRYQEEFLNAPNMESVSYLRGINTGIDFIMDRVEVAKEELLNRGDKSEETESDEVDKGDKLK